MNTEKIIGADGFMNEVGTAKAASSVATIKESDKTANQLYNEYKAEEKKKGNNKLTPFKDWLKKAQAEGTLKNIQEQTMSLIGDVVEIAKRKKDGLKSTDAEDDILAMVDKADMDSRKPAPSPAFLGVPMPVWYVGIGLVVVVGGLYVLKGASGSNDAQAK